MTNKKNTKQALLMSVLALVLCVSMLVGSTFAWFTDSVTSGLNKIQSGTLDIKLEHSYGFYDGPVEEVTATTELFKHNVDGEAILWEPGVSMVEYFTITNAGNLALKFDFNLVTGNATATAEGKTLLDVLRVQAMQSSTTAEHLKNLNSSLLPDPTVHTSYELNDFGYENYLLPGENVVFAVHVMWEPTNHDNDYNVPGGLNLDLGVMLRATQYTYEKDSMDDQYDKDATYPVFANNGAELADAIANAKPGTVITLSEGVEYGAVTAGELKDVVIKGAEGSTLIFKAAANSKIENVTLQEVNFKYTGATADCGVVIDGNAQIENLVIENCEFTGTGAKAGRGLSGYNNNASIVIKDCTFKDLGYPIYAWGGFESLTVDNCTFENIKSWAIMPQSGFDGDLTVTNCKFVDCLGGGLVKAGTLTAGHTFTFTNNTVTGCTVAGDHNWFQFKVSAGTTVIANNTKDGVAWTPGAADGLK